MKLTSQQAREYLDGAPDGERAVCGLPRYWVKKQGGKYYWNHEGQCETIFDCDDWIPCDPVTGELLPDPDPYALQQEITRLRAVIADTCEKIRPPLMAIKQGGMHECSSEYIEKIINRAENALEEK
jgi:hypothetical protein